jgi:hypothetical protein
LALRLSCSISAGVLCSLLGGVACSEVGSSLAPSPVDADVERDGWVDVAVPIAGDGDTAFVSGLPARSERRPERFWLDSLYTSGGAEANPAAIEGGRVYGLSRFRGLVITDATAPAPARVEGELPLYGRPVALSVRDGIVLALLDAAPPAACASGGCAPPPEGEILLIDAREPSAPRVLAERRVPGFIHATHRVGDTLLVLSRTLVECTDCMLSSETSATLTAFDLADPLALSGSGPIALRTPIPAVTRAYRFDGERLYIATQDASVEMIDLTEGGLIPGGALPKGYLRDDALHVEAGRLRVSVMTEPIQVDPKVTTVDAEFSIDESRLDSVEPAVFTAPSGERVAPVFHAGGAFGLADSGRTLVSFDLSEREAPRATGSVALPFRADQLFAAGDAQLVALGAPDERGHAALVDARELAAPVVQSEVSWDNGLLLPGSLRFDAASGLVLVAYQGYEDSQSRVQILSTADGTLTLGENFIGWGILENYALDATSVVQMRNASLSIHDATADGELATLVLARPADAVRITGDRVLGFASETDSQVLLLAPGGAEDEGAIPSLDAATSQRWRPWAYRRNQQLYLAEEPTTGSGSLAIYTFYESGEGITTSSATSLMPTLEGERYMDVIHTERSVIVARGDLDQLNADDPEQVAEPGSRLAFDVVDVSMPGAARRSGHLDIPPALIAGGFGRWPKNTSIDTAWGWRWLASGSPLVASGDILVSQHAERVDARHERMFLDRIDVSDPDAPRLLPPVNIPGYPVAFDAASGSLITIETLRFEDRSRSREDCESRGYLASYDGQQQKCAVLRRALSGLSLSGDTATRHSQLLLDSSRRTLTFAASGSTLHYVTEPALSDDEAASAYAAYQLDGTAPVGVKITLERVRIQDGALERLPSVDISTLHPTSPRDWTLFARANRAFTRTGNSLGVIDFEADTPQLRSIDLPNWGCRELEVAGDQVYCAGGAAGLQVVPLESGR